MSGANVNFSPLCGSGFLQGARKWKKTSEPIVFVILGKRAALCLSISDGQVRPEALLSQFQVQEKLHRFRNYLFALFSKFHTLAHNMFSHMILIWGIVWNEYQSFGAFPPLRWDARREISKRLP